VASDGLAKHDKNAFLLYSNETTKLLFLGRFHKESGEDRRLIMSGCLQKTSGSLSDNSL
jgi:hypothetical protein